MSGKIKLVFQNKKNGCFFKADSVTLSGLESRAPAHEENAIKVNVANKYCTDLLGNYNISAALARSPDRV